MAEFYGALKTSILDLVRTEDDFDQWKQACLELHEMMQILNEGVDRNILLNGDYSETLLHWNQLINQIYQRYPDSRLLKAYYSLLSF
jgi:hypothetical protein